MSFLASLLSAVIDIVLTIVEILVQIVEFVLEFIMALLGYDESTQIIEFFEVHNIALFSDVDQQNPLRNVLINSIISGSDIAGSIIHASVFRSLKGDIQDFLDYIDDGHYMEYFPAIDSYITYPDYTELTDVLTALEGEACTIENAYTKAPSQREWVEYWLQENHLYSYEDKEIPGISVIDESTSPVSSGTGVGTGGSAPSWTVSATETLPISDAITATIGPYYIDFATIVYNSGPDTYSVDFYDDAGVYSTFASDAPAKPIGLHYVASYYKNSTPGITYLFMYEVGEGTYPDLDDPQNEINLDATVLHALPAIPLRINNVDYLDVASAPGYFCVESTNHFAVYITDDLHLNEETFVNGPSVGTSSGIVPASRARQIEELCALLTIDAEEVLYAIKDDPDAPSAGDLDHIYLTFGIRLWDVSQTGLAYLFGLCENVYPTQGVTKGIYDAAPSGDTKPVNNIIVTTADYKSIFQFNYLSYTFTTLATIDGDSGSDENGYYYSDMSKFDDDDVLVYPYYISSGKGTYNVGFKADNLDEVQDFLDGNGVVNPGDTTGEATNWMQVTARMNYNNTTPVLEDADGSTSDLVFLTPDLVYENNGSGVLRHVQVASEETTSGQSITYYRAIASGLEAYTMAAPIGSLKVIDADTGAFKMVKFNLGHQDDLMVPFIYNFIAHLSNKDVTQLFLAGAHASIYVAHYEVIVQRTGGFGFLLMIILIIIIIVVVVASAGAAGPAFGGMFASTTTASGTIAGSVAYSGAATIGAGGVVTATAGPLAGSIIVGGTVTSTAAITGIVTTGVISGAGVAGALSVAWIPTIAGWATSFLVNQIISFAVGKIAEKSPGLAAVFSVLATVTIGSFSVSGNASTGFSANFNLPGFSDVAKMFAYLTGHAGSIVDIYLDGEYDDLEQAYDADRDLYNSAMQELQEQTDVLARLHKETFSNEDGQMLAQIMRSTLRARNANILLAETAFHAFDAIYDAQYFDYEYSARMDYSLSGPRNLYT